VIQNFTELTERLGINAVFVPLVVAAVLTATIFFAQSVARWFEDRNP
jgi:hypothetical protein